MTHHISKGETIAQSMKDRFDYGQNPEKTQGGELISAYECDHRTADAEFLLAKAKYKAVTGREQKRDADVLCYQIRQAFKPGEITPEEANRVGYETAVSYTHLDVYKRQIVAKGRTTIDDRLKARVCELCSRTDVKLEVHHVNKVKNLKGKEPWEQVMIAKRRKTLAVCHDCHQKIHHGF